MLPLLGIRGLASLLPRFLGRGSTQVFRGETLPHSARQVSSYLTDDLDKVGRFASISPKVANRYAMKGSDLGVPIVRSGRINPRAGEALSTNTFLLDASRGALPVDRMRSIGLNLKDIIRPSTASFDDFLVGGGKSSINFQGIKNLMRKIKDPRQREILLKLFFGSTRGLKLGGKV
tara:strand:+ start:119 stop:646 length:528 start_codon:yes stop_codon:yes gene_type:complete